MVFMAVAALKGTGRLTHYIGETPYEMNPGDSIAVPAGAPHHAVNTGDEPAEMIVVCSCGERDFKLEPELA